MLVIQKIILHNFKRFDHLELDVNPGLNIFVGDNESGKSTLLLAIDLVARGSFARVQEIGLERLFNIQAVKSFLNSTKSITQLPEMYVELYFNEQDDINLYGATNSKNISTSGIRMRCAFNDQYGEIVNSLYLADSKAPFPFEFYTVSFETFSGVPYVAYSKKLHSLFIDNSQVGSPVAMRDYVSAIYQSTLSEQDRFLVNFEYRKHKQQFENKFFAEYNQAIAPRSFVVRKGPKDNLETDISIVDNEILLENKGTGSQCFIKTLLSLQRKIDGIDVVLIEEPENHLSYMKTMELIRLIQCTQNRQLFISTHSDLIATRLDLRNCRLLNSASTKIVSLNSLSEETAKFFVKSPDNNMLQFILSDKSILVEGDAEYILMEAMSKQTLRKDLIEAGIGVISVDGKCFKRYLEIAKILNNKVAVITDNDGNYQESIENTYSEYTSNQYPNIRIFSDKDSERYTFEVCIYKDNQAICDETFSSSRRQLPIVDYMLHNKTEAAYLLMCNKANEIATPIYIQEALQWIDD